MHFVYALCICHIRSVQFIKVGVAAFVSVWVSAFVWVCVQLHVDGFTIHWYGVFNFTWDIVSLDDLQKLGGYCCCCQFHNMF